MFGEPERMVIRARGGNTRTILVSDRFANVYDARSGVIVRTEIIRVKANRASRDFERRGVITKGAIIETKIGDARVVSKPGSDGVINAVLLSGSPA
jgi:small subunit ribosomal protein S8e